MVKVQGFINLYHSGWYHRAGKPGDINIHGGDVYLSREIAESQAEPDKGYMGTIPIEFWASDDPVANPPDSQPYPLSQTRRMFKEGGMIPPSPTPMMTIAAVLGHKAQLRGAVEHPSYWPQSPFTDTSPGFVYHTHGEADALENGEPF